MSIYDNIELYTSNRADKMEYYTVEQFIKKHLKYKQHWNKKIISLKDAKPQFLENDTHIGGIDYAKGSEFKVFETTNFGWVTFHRDTKTPDGHIPGKLIQKW